MIKLAPHLLFRTEADGTGILFDPNDGQTFLLNRTSALICRCLEKGAEKSAILAEIAAHADNVPENAAAEVDAFIETLRERGYLVP